LEELATLLLVPFEQTIRALARMPQEKKQYWQARFEKWAQDLGVFAGLDKGYILPWPPVVLPMDEHLVSRALLWRITLARVASDYLFRNSPKGVDDPFTAEGIHNAWLWADTHKDMMITLALATNGYGGARACTDRGFWLVPRDGHGQVPLTEAYPQPHRVLCPEEMPDLVPWLVHADLAYDTAKQKKKTPTLMREIVHLFLCKVMNQICHRRHMNRTMFEYVRAHGEVAQLVRIVLHCSLLGNLPTCREHLGWAARIHLALQLPITAEAAAATDFDSFKRWADAHPAVIMFSLREWFLYTVEASRVYDSLLGQHVKWADFKAGSRHAMDEVRRELTRQAATKGPAAPVDWSTIETPPKQKKSKGAAVATAATTEEKSSAVPITLGLLNRNHTHILSTFMKLRKGLARHVIFKKMTSEESTVLDHYVWQAIRGDPVLSHALERLASQLKERMEKQGATRLRHELDLMLTFRATLPLENEEQEEAVISLISAVHNHYYPHVVQQHQSMVALLNSRPKEAPLSCLVRRALMVTCYWDAFHAHVVQRHVAPSRIAHFRLIAPALHAVADRAARISTRPHVAARDYETPELRWLEVLGMSPERLEEIRVWFYKYGNFDQPDDRFKHWARLLGLDSLDDFLLLKAYLRLIQQYSTTTITFLSAGALQRQLWALRTRMHLRPSEPTPEMLGRALFCSSPTCSHWITTPQLAPVWTACEHDARQRAIAVKRYTTANGRELAIADYIHRLVPVGQSRALFDPRTGHMFCPLSKKMAASADESRAAAGVMERVGDPEGGANAAAANGNQSVATAFADFMEAELEARDHMARKEATAAVAQQDDDDDDHDEDADEDGKKKKKKKKSDSDSESDSDSNSSSDEEDDSSSSDEEEENDRTRLIADLLDYERQQTEPEADLALPDKEEKARAKAERRHIRRRTTKALQAIQAPVDSWTSSSTAASCRTTPLVEADATGVIYRQGREAVALCTYCGDLMQVTNDKWTNHGLSCMNHAHTDEFPLEHPQRQAFAHQTRLAIATATGELADHLAGVAAAAAAAATTTTGGAPHLTLGSRRAATIGLTAGDHDRLLEDRHPHILHAPVPCVVCHERPTRKVR
jgi:hypothetical protein